MCITFYVKLEHSSMETIWMIQKAKNCGQLCGSFITTMCPFVHHVSCSFFGDPGDSASLCPDLVPCDFWLFPKLKTPLKGKRFHTVEKIQENTMGQLMAGRRTVRGPKVPTLKGTEASLSYEQCFLYLVSSLINVSIFQFLLCLVSTLKCSCYHSTFLALPQQTCTALDLAPKYHQVF